jgi:lipopolysaccharide export system protein LptA
MKSSNRGLLAIGLFSVLLFCITPVGAARNTNLPVEITADTAEYDEKAATVTYIGNVLVVQGTAELRCARLTLHQPEGGPQRIVAEGNPVKFHQPPEDGMREIDGRADRAEYDLDQRLLTLIGNAELLQQGDSVTSDRIVYDMASATVRAGAAADGAERVRTVIQPRN